MPKSTKRLRAVKFFNELWGIIYEDFPQEAHMTTLIYEVWAQGLITSGRQGLTPAQLARIHRLPQETARRRLQEVAKSGHIVKRGREYYISPKSYYPETFDKFVELLERYR